MGRDPEDAADFLHAEFTGRKELAVLRGKGDRFIRHALFQDSHLVRVPGAAIGVHPVIPYLLRIFQDAGVLQNPGRLRSVFEEGTSVFLDSKRRAEGVLHHGNGRETDQPIEAKPWDMQNLIPLENDVLIMLTWHLVCVGVVGIKQVAVFRPVDLHIFREQWIKPQNSVFAITDDLCVGVSPKEQMHHHGFPEGETRHLRVCLPVQDFVERMVCRTFLAVTLVGELVKMERQACHRLRQEPDTGIHRRNLERGFFIHPLAAVCHAEDKNAARIPDVVFDLWKLRIGSVPRLTEAKPFPESHLLLLHLCQLPVARHEAHPVDAVPILPVKNIVFHKLRDPLNEVTFLSHRQFHKRLLRIPIVHGLGRRIRCPAVRGGWPCQAP